MKPVDFLGLDLMGLSATYGHEGEALQLVQAAHECNLHFLHGSRSYSGRIIFVHGSQQAWLA